MPQALIAKLERFSRLSSGERSALIEALSGRVRRLGAREDIIREGETPDHVNIVLSGWACRYKTLEDGRRQIIGYLVPGDLCDLKVFILRQMDHSIGTITGVQLAEMPREIMQTLTDGHSRLARALWWSALVAEATEREWIVSLGQRTAFERLGHLFCELFLRLQNVGLTDGQSCEMPLTQVDLADTMGLSAVHVNRTLQELRAARLIVFKGKTLTIPDFARLQTASLFTPNYLHQDREGHEFDADEG